MISYDNGDYLTIWQPLARLGAKVTGIDAVASSILAADAHAKIDQDVAKNVNYVCSTIEDMVDEYKDSFDAVVASEVIEHVNNQPHFIKSCSELIKVYCYNENTIILVLYAFFKCS